MSGSLVRPDLGTEAVDMRPDELHLDIVRWCSTCADYAFLERPDCDAHGSDCPERVCVGCGEALLVGFDLPEPTRAARRPGRVA
jgi:hypothetical protein